MQRCVAVGLFVVAVSAPACIPYTVGTTAQPVTPGQQTTSMMMYAQPSVNLDTSSRSPYATRRGLAVDGEVRWGVNDHADVGLRTVGFSGVVVNYKQMLSDTAGLVRAAVMPGFGFVNGGQHVYGEFTLVVSGQEPPTGLKWEGNHMVIVPYGGLRVSQVAPIQENAVHDQPTYGAFLGVRFGTTNFGISPEIGVFHDHSVLGVRRGDIVIVPALVLHGNELISIFRRLPRTYMGSGPEGLRRARGRTGATPLPTDVPILPPILTPPYNPAVAPPPLVPPPTGTALLLRRPTVTCSAPQPGCIATRRSAAAVRRQP